MRTNANKNEPFRWTAKSEKAAKLVAEDHLTDRQIAEEVGVHVATLERWKAVAAFAERVDSHVTTYRKRILSRGIAVLENRVAALNDRWEKLQAVIDSRASNMTEEECPGGSTGTIVRKPVFVKVIEHRTSQRVTFDDLADEDFTPTKQSRLEFEYAVDTGLLTEIRNLEKQAAQETGQWKDRAEVEVRDTSALESVKRRLLSQAGPGSHSEPPGEPAGK